MLGSSIVRESYAKHVAIPGVGVIAFCGENWPTKKHLEGVKSWDELESRCAAWEASGSDGPASPWNGLAYNVKARRIMLLDWNSTMTLADAQGAGSGGDMALGYYLGRVDSQPPKGLLELADLVRSAIRAACKRDAGCGGRIRVVVCNDKTGDVVELR